MRRIPFPEAGIYSITCDPTERVYVGSAAFAVWDRWIKHLSELRRGTHFCQQMQSDWDWYGETEFTFGLLEVDPSGPGVFERLRPLELRWIEVISAHQLVYNRFGVVQKQS